MLKRFGHIIKFNFRNASILLIFMVIFPKMSFAYLDQGSGSYILQLIIAAIAGGLFSIRLLWSRIKYWFTSKRKKEEQND